MSSVRSAGACSYGEIDTVMLLWFVIVAPIAVAEVFRSPMVDYRLVAFGGIVPLVEVLLGQSIGLHSLAASVLLLTLVMGATVGRRLLRRRLLGVPIGMFMHLVLDGTWTSSRLFWWPAFGLGLDDQTVPESGRSLFVLVFFEILAIAFGWWAWRRYELGDRNNLRILLRHGHLARAVLAP